MLRGIQLINDSYAQSFQQRYYNYELISYIRDSQQIELFPVIVGNLNARHWETSANTPVISGFKIGFVQSLASIILSVICIVAIMCVRAKYKTEALVKIILLLVQTGTVCVHVAQIFASGTYNSDNEKLLDDYRTFVSNQDTLISLFTNRINILKFATCNESIKMRAKDMYCVGFNYQVGQFNNR